jgi:hypothetical protein
MTAAPRLQTQASVRLTRQRTAGAFALLSCFVGFCAFVLTLGGVYTAWDRGRVFSSPTVDAVVRKCALHRDYPFRSDGGGVSFSVVCDVAYRTGDDQHTGRVQSQWRHAGSSGTNYRIGFGSLTVEHPEQILTEWIHRHPPGTVLPLHQRRGGNALTFIGFDPVIDVDPVPEYRVGFAVFIAIALALALASRFLRQSA